MFFGKRLRAEIATRERMERSLRESEERFQVLARELRANRAELTVVTENAAVMLTHCDRNARYVYVNRAYTERLGRSAEDVIGRRVEDVVGSTTYAVLEPHIRRVLAGSRTEFDVEVNYPVQGRRFMHCVYVPDRDEQTAEVQGFVAALTDLTERRRLEEQLRDADRRKDEFLAVLAHELRNPLAPIRNAVHFLGLKGPREPAIQNAVQIIERQATHMARLVDDLLEISRITGGRIRLENQPVNLSVVITNAIEACRPAIQSARQKLEVDVSPDQVYVMGDVVRLSQVVTNLLTNANKYTPSGGRIDVTLRREGQQALVRISDTGIGIPREMRERVFEMFVQLESAHERSRGGLGVGLTLAKRLVELHGGGIDLESEGSERGSAFTIRLPLLDAPAIAQSIPVAEDVGVAAAHILIADDNVDAAESLAAVLRSLGHSVEVAYDGANAVALAERGHPDVVILDIGMPRMDGYEAARRIRGLPFGRQCQLVALTGWGQEDDKRRAREAGFDQHLTKPIDPPQLTLTIARRSQVSTTG